MKFIFFILLACSTLVIANYIGKKELPVVRKAFAPAAKVPGKILKPDMLKLAAAAEEMYVYARNHHMDTSLFFIIDMAKPSGAKRFYVFDRTRNDIIDAGLVTHGQGKEIKHEPSFSNEPGSYCTSVGLYKIGNEYQGKFGLSYKLKGLEASNSNAFKRFVVLHGHDCVPEEEVYPQSICQSQGCPTVAPVFLQHLSGYIRKQPQEILLQILQ